MVQQHSETEGLLPVWKVAKDWHRSASELYKEIEGHDYREEQGVFFRHLGRRAWRINRFQYMWWRRLPLSASGEVRVMAFSAFLLQHIEQAITGMLELQRFLLAEHEAAALRVEQPGSSTNHPAPEVKP
jgi:hypothetical protein